MSVVNTYHVFYHFEQSGKIAGDRYSDYVQAAAGDYNSLNTVLSGVRGKT